MHSALFLVFRLMVKIFAALYGGEGINIPLTFAPTRWIAPTLRAYGAQIGERVRFRSPLVVHNSSVTSSMYYSNLVVGSDCYFGRELFLDLQDRIVVGDQVTVSHRAMLLTHTDAGTTPLKGGVIPTSQAPVTIRRGAYVGAHATLLQGVEIGQGAVVGAGAVVTRSIPAHTVAVGVPAKAVRTLPIHMPHADGE